MKILCIILLSLGINIAYAEERQALNENKPFAKAHVIMQISDAGPAHYQAALDISNNLLRHYGGQDMVDIEIIAFGAGIPMLLAEDNTNAQRISSLMAYGVRFYACGNTLDTLERKQKQRPELLTGVRTVQTGVAFMIDEVQRGYFHLHL